MAAMAGILPIKMPIVVFLVSVIPSRYHGGKKKHVFEAFQKMECCKLLMAILVL
jgi:hypothetical protein